MGGDSWIIRCTESGLALGCSWALSREVWMALLPRTTYVWVALRGGSSGGGKVLGPHRRGEMWGGARQGFARAKQWKLKVAPVAPSVDTVLGDAEVAVASSRIITFVMSSAHPWSVGPELYLILWILVSWTARGLNLLGEFSREFDEKLLASNSPETAHTYR
ncbi:hypothetical protein K438DRAFT_1945186 [Mycena galopus ATCC 62051]|nr:hypothetical protein K438DRAFT_1945186 [Mycena galopus ATCC 62051]